MTSPATVADVIADLQLLASETPPPAVTPLLTTQGFAVSGKFSDDLAALCNTAAQNGMTPNMISGQLWNMASLIGVTEAVRAMTSAAPTPPQPGIGGLLFVNGVSTTEVVAGQSIILKIDTLTKPDSDGVVIDLSLDPSHSVEVTWSEQNGFTYTVGGYWNGKTFYAKPGDMIEFVIIIGGGVNVSLSQDGAKTWNDFESFPTTVATPTFVYLAGTDAVEVTVSSGS